LSRKLWPDANGFALHIQYSLFFTPLAPSSLRYPAIIFLAKETWFNYIELSDFWHALMKGF